MINIESLAKVYGGKPPVHAVDGVSFVAPDGQITGLLGPNGAGKTTLLRMLATLVEPSAGAASASQASAGRTAAPARALGRPAARPAAPRDARVTRRPAVDRRGPRAAAGADGRGRGECGSAMRIGAMVPRIAPIGP
jgi:energy-coupling factor transporter ATP-binding protein EcfA2